MAFQRAIAVLAAAVVTGSGGGGGVEVVSAWSTLFYYKNAKPSSPRHLLTSVNGKHHHHQRIPHHNSNLILLSSQPNDEDNDDTTDDGPESVERRRKRDIIKRTLGLGGGTASSSGGDQGSNKRVKLNTDKLFKGMPGMDSILGSSGGLPNAMPDNLPSSSSSSQGNNNIGDNRSGDGFQKQGEVKKDPNLLTPEDIAELDSKYDAIQYQSERLVSDELSRGGQFGKSSGSDDGIILSETDEDIGGMNITQEEAKKIVDYAIQEEKLTEKRLLDLSKKQALVEQWEQQGLLSEQSIEDNLRSASNDEEVDDIIRNDAVSREIIDNAISRSQREDEQTRQRQELDFYKRQLEQRREVEGVVEKAAADLGAVGNDADIDKVYEAALKEIQSSRKNKLGPKTLGVYANSIALEQGRAYVESQKSQKEFLKEVEIEAGLVGKSDEEVAIFFKAPKNYEEERIYRSIVRRIVNNRSKEEEPDTTTGATAVVSDGTEDEDEGPFIQEEDTKARYKLSAKETVEAYKLLNLWREMHSTQDEMERALGMKDDSSSSNTSARSGSSSANTIGGKGKLEPFFLYEEDSEEKRLKERENLIKVLSKGLESDDDVEKSSNELLMKELFGSLDDDGGGFGGGSDAGTGVTKDRAIRLLDKLLKKSKSGSIIQSSLRELKATILAEDDDDDNTDNDVEGSGGGMLFRKKKVVGGPVDLSGVFRTSGMEGDDEDEPKTPSFPTRPTEESSAFGGGGRTMPSWVDEEKKESTMTPPPPNTPFVSSSSIEEETTTTSSTSASSSSSPLQPPPNTPFFQSETGEEGIADGNPTSGMFGTYEEQKLQKLANKVGARSDEEMEELRRNMEAIKEAEEMANMQLSDDDFDIEAASAKLGIDVSSLDFDDDSDDQIMSILGKRPMASSSPSSTTPSEDQQTRKVIVEINEEETDDIIVDAEGHLKKMAKRKPDEEGKRDIADDIFRAKTAGKYTDKESRDAAEAAYKDFIKMEQEAEKRLDQISDDSLLSLTNSEDIDDIDAYADDIMSEIKPRPQVRGRREDFMSREDVQRERKKESIFGDDDPFPTKDDGGSSASSSSSQSSISGGDMPEWFRMEQEELGVKMEDLTEDEFDEARRAWEREERQRKADEYFKKRGEGISISDVLGREYFGPMDEPDDPYDTTRSTFDSFAARKELLLGYTELTVEDLNNVVDYKVDPLATGYNPHLSRVQRPFSEYGAIFRLEGVLVDMVGIHASAWKHVAEEYGYQIESSDDLRRASLYKPEGAIRDVFYWTDDIFELKDMAERHRAAFNDAFDEWFESGGKVVFASEDDEISSNLDYAPEVPKATPSDEEMNSMYFLAWSKLSKNLDKTAPTNDQVYRGVMGGDWEIAVKDIFGWSEDPDEVYDIVVAYDEILQADYKVLLHKYGIDLDRLDAQQNESQLFSDLTMKEGVKEWIETLQEVEMPCAVVSHLDSSQLDAVLNATGLAEYFPPDRRVTSESGYSNERSELLGAALRVEQRPDKCVIFDNTPHSANEAHEVYMKSVSLVDHYARYELLTADLSVGLASDLDLISFTKLFDERTDLDLEPVLELDVSSGLQKQTRKAKTAFWDE